jgi:aspartyl-tRNA(Asn)/glutamyl-tRNA(Gln) amidotransferase subunit A
MNIADAAPRVARGELRSERLTEECLDRIRDLNPTLNAFITITADEALAQARAADKAIAGGRYLGPLHGIPMSLKDLVDLAGTPTTAASRVRRHHMATTDAVVTTHLKDAGAVFVGKTNLHEFAFGTTSEDSGFGPARNPVDPSRSPGGSSGGSAIAVATGMSLGAVGTDTGGSIRIPAAACGLVGLKPGWGEISAEGVFPLSRQLDHVGPLARSVTDAWLQYNALLPADRRDTAALEARPLGQLRLGMPSGYLFDRLDADVESRVQQAIETLRRLGARITDVSIPHAADIPPIYLHLVFGDAAEIHQHTLESQPDDYTPNVRLRLQMAGYVMAEDYVRALRGKAVIAAEVDQSLTGVDALVCPALSIPAPPIGATTMPVRGGVETVRTLMLRCTQPFNVSGHPAIALPCGATPEGLPTSLQLVGHRSDTPALLQTALAVERALAPHHGA